MRILGIDPGVASTGWGVVDCDNEDNDNLTLVDFGVIRTPSGTDQGIRLNQIYRDLTKIIKNYKPEVAAVEQLFFCRNAKTAISVGEARGIVLLSISQNGLLVKEFTPLQVKNGICGYGKADKAQVQQMVKVLLNMESVPRPDDAADGLAVAICCSSHVNFDRKSK